MNKKAILEGLLFVVGEEGLSITQAKEILELEPEELASLISELQASYDSPDHGIQLEILGSYLKLTTKKEHHDYYQKLVEIDSSHLSPASLETLAIIAYQEPITRVEIDEIRGVNSSHQIRKLLARDLIQELGRSDQAGRPILYGVTKDFYDYFGISNKEELPKLEELEPVPEEERDLFTSKYQEIEQ